MPTGAISWDGNALNSEGNWPIPELPTWAFVDDDWDDEDAPPASGGCCVEDTCAKLGFNSLDALKGVVGWAFDCVGPKYIWLALIVRRVPG